MAGHRREDLTITVALGEGHTVAATVHLPDAATLRPDAPILACFAGAGYGRQYFDLPQAGYSQAEYHVKQGFIVVAIDHLATGDSSVPAPEHCRYTDVAAANHAALAQILGGLQTGEIGGAGRIGTGPVIGVGHSMGGLVIIAMQAAHRSFDGLAILGSSMVHIKVPSTTPWETASLPRGVEPNSPEGFQALHAVNWRRTGYWEDVPEDLVQADMASLPPTRNTEASWHSATLPNVGSPLQSAVASKEAAIVDVPILFAVGERDTNHDLLREIAAFHSAKDIAICEVPRMAHIHNFAGTRREMWLRVETFARHVEALASLNGAS